jgi:hypothetical protein
MLPHEQESWVKFDRNAIILLAVRKSRVAVETWGPTHRIYQVGLRAGARQALGAVRPVVFVKRLAQPQAHVRERLRVKVWPQIRQLDCHVSLSEWN